MVLLHPGNMGFVLGGLFVKSIGSLPTYVMTAMLAETLDYIRCMTITKNVDPKVYFAITPENISEIKKYIDDPMTATTFKNYGKSGRHGKDIITSEVIYYQMFECEKWHLNRLLTLIEVCNRKNSPDKKMSKKQIADQNRALNALRRKKFGTRG